MNRLRYSIINLLLILIMLSMSGCGYRPSAKFARIVLGDKISTSVVISSRDPENTVIIKDAVDRAIIEVFHASLTDREHSETHLSLKIDNPSYSPIQYNVDGFIVGYRMRVHLNITKYHNGSSKTYSVSGSYDFSVQANAIVTDQDRFRAINLSAKKAIEAFVAKVSAEGSKETSN